MKRNKKIEKKGTIKRATLYEVDRSKEITLDDLFALDNGLVYVEDDNRGGGYALSFAYPDVIWLYRADSPADECSYDFSEDDGWIKDDSLHIFACKEVHHDAN